MIDRRIQNTVSYIDNNFTRDLSLSTLSDVACLSSFHLSRLFSATVGKSITEYIQQKRIEYSKELIASTDLSITCISLEAGFNTISNFNRAFKQIVGCSPLRYKQQNSIKEEEDSRKKVAQIQRIQHNYPISSFIRRIIEMNLKEETLGDMHVAYCTHKGSYLETGNLWKRLMEWTIPNNLFPPQYQYFGISYDEPEVADDQKTSDVCVILPNEYPETDTSILYKTVKGGLFLKYEYYDTNERFGLVYKDVVTDYLPTSIYGLDLDRCFLEFIKNDPFTDPEHKVRVDLYIPVGLRTNDSRQKRG
jgi:AraC family transcriptional regulator